MSKVKVTEITTPTCGVCKMIAPMIEKAVGSFTSEELDFHKLCVGVDAEADEYVKRGDIQSVPVFFFEVDGKETVVHHGALNLPQFKTKVKEMMV